MCLGSQDGLFGEGSPSALCQCQSTTKLPGQRRHWQGRKRALSSSHAAHLHKEPFQSYWLAELLLGFFQCLCTEYQSSSLTGLPHKLATVTKSEAQNEGYSSQAPQRRTPVPTGSCGTGASVCSLETEPSQSGILYRKNLNNPRQKVPICFSLVAPLSGSDTKIER